MESALENPLPTGEIQNISEVSASQTLGTGTEIEFPGIPNGSGTLEISVESIRERNLKRYSILARRVEVWFRDRRIASSNKGDESVEESAGKRIFRFGPLEMPVGYHFISIRMYGDGWLSRNEKFKQENIQIGIHKGKLTRVSHIIPFHVW